MANWSARSTGYKLGVGLMFLGALFFVVGFGLPFWIMYDTSNYMERYSTYKLSHALGLWMRCRGSDCASHGMGGSRGVGWFTAIQVLQCFALVGIGVSVLFFFYANCIQDTFNTPRVLEVTTGLSGLLGFIGCMVFIGKGYFWQEVLSWGFGIDVTGCLLLMASALLIGITSQAGNDPAPSTTGSKTAFSFDSTGGQPGQIIALPNTQSNPPPQAGYQQPPSTQSYPPPQAGYQQQPNTQNYPPPQAGYQQPPPQGN